MTTDNPGHGGAGTAAQRRPETDGPWRGDRRQPGNRVPAGPPGAERAASPAQRPSERPSERPADRPAGREPGRGEGRNRDERRGEIRKAREQVQARTRAPHPRTRRAQLRAARLDPWSVMKVSFMLSIALAIVGVVAVTVLWSALSAAGVFETVNSFVRDKATFGEQGLGFDVLRYVGLNRVLGVTLLLAVVNVVLWTALATLFSFVYNLTAGLLGGIEVTLAETE